MTRFTEIWETQRESLRLGEEAEMRNRCLEFEGAVTDFDDPMQQKKLRRYAWQIVEEVAELLDASTNETIREEAADVLCFLIDLSILAKVELNGGPIDLLDRLFAEGGSFGDLPRTCFARFVNELGMTMNELKNRPWRVDRRPTNVPVLQAKIHQLWRLYASGCIMLGITSEELGDAHEAKTVIIRKRLETDGVFGSQKTKKSPYEFEPGAFGGELDEYSPGAQT